MTAWPEPVERVARFLRETGTEARVEEFGDGTPTAEDAARAAGILGAVRVVPLHFEHWGHFTEDGPALTKAFAQAGLTDRLRLPVPGASVRVP